MNALKSAVIVLLVSAVFAQKENCQNGGTSTGNDQAPCICPSPFYGEYCEYIFDTTTPSGSTDLSTTQSSWTTTTSDSKTDSTTQSGTTINCMNGGVQIGNFCYCRAPYYGDRCQYGGNTTATTTPVYNATTTSSNGNFSTPTAPSKKSSMCLNGGVQIGKFCYCKEPFTGNRCQNDGNSTAVVRNKRSIGNVFSKLFGKMKNLWSNETETTTITTQSWLTTTQSGSTINCTNDGVQIGNFCYCRAPYYGDRCQYGGNTTATTTPMYNSTTTSSSTDDGTTTSLYNATTASSSESFSTPTAPSKKSSMCLNGGVQIGKFCYCKEPFTGNRCQYDGNSAAVKRNKRAIDDIVAEILGGQKDDSNQKSTTQSSWTTTTPSDSMNMSTTASGATINCTNGGVQIGNFCYCRAPYYGDRCQYGGNTTATTTPMYNTTTTSSSTDDGSTTETATSPFFTTTESSSTDGASTPIRRVRHSRKMNNRRRHRAMMQKAIANVLEQIDQEYDQ